MAKEIKARVKLQLPAGKATPAPPVGSSLGQHQVNLMDFCKKFNALTAPRMGETVPVQITIYKDKTFDMVTKTSPASELIKKRANITKGANKPGSQLAGTIKMKDIEEIAKLKMVDLNANDLQAASKIIAGSARSMGLKVEE